MYWNEIFNLFDFYGLNGVLLKCKFQIDFSFDTHPWSENP